MLVIFAIISYANAGDTVQKIFNVNWNADYADRECSINCGADIECKNQKILCNLLVKIPGSAADQELFKLTLRVVSTAITSLLNYASSNMKLNNSTAISFYTHLDDQLPSLIGPKLSKAKLFSGANIVEFFIDIALDILIDYRVKTLTSQQLQNLRGLWYVHDSAPDETLRQAIKMMLTLAKNDTKALAMIYMGNPVGAIGAGVIDNLILVTDIGVKTSAAAADFFEAEAAAAQSSKMFEVLNLRISIESSFYKEKDRVKKANIIESFEVECKKIELTKGSFFAAQLHKKGYGWRIDEALNAQCMSYVLDMYLNDNKKEFLALSNVKTLSRQRYIKLINYYYPTTDKAFYLKLYDLNNFVPYLGVSSNAASYKYLKQLNAYGVRIQKGLFSSYEDAPIGLAANMISIAKTKKATGASAIISKAGYTTTTRLTRRIYSKLLVDNFNIANVKLNKNPLATFLQWKIKNRVYADSRLAAFEIIPSGEITNNTVYALKSNKTIKHYDLVQMLSDTLDVVTCGHKGCSYEDIIKEGN